MSNTLRPALLGASAALVALSGCASAPSPTQSQERTVAIKIASCEDYYLERTKCQAWTPDGEHLVVRSWHTNGSAPDEVHAGETIRIKPETKLRDGGWVLVEHVSASADAASPATPRPKI